MKVQTRLRLSKTTLTHVKDVATFEQVSVSEEVRRALEPYLAGVKKLPKMPPPGEIATTCVLEHDDVLYLQQIAGEANFSVDEALRYAIQEYLHEHAQNSKTSR